MSTAAVHRKRDRHIRRVRLALKVITGFAGIALVATLVLGGCFNRAMNLLSGVYRPPLRDFEPHFVNQLSLPSGFELTLFASRLERPRMLATDANGVLYVTLPDEGQVLALEDRDGDGVAERRRRVIDELDGVHGIALSSTTMWLATEREVWRVPLPANSPAQPELWLQGLPEPGRHANRTLGIGPDGHVFLSIGSSCNACEEEHAEQAALIRFSPDGQHYEIFARGLRNTIGFDWHPTTHTLWGADHGTDWLGPNTPPDELNHIEQGRHYGWPYVFGNRKLDPDLDAEEGFAEQTEPPRLALQAHSAPIGFVFYRGSMFPEEYRGDAFVALHGSWNREVPVGYQVARVHFEQAKPERLEPFLAGFLSEDRDYIIGRPAGLAVANDGALFVSDDASGAVYRVTYRDP